VIILPHHVHSRHVLSGHGRSHSNVCFALVASIGRRNALS
jgi:hypothetical protein